MVNINIDRTYLHDSGRAAFGGDFIMIFSLVELYLVFVVIYQKL